MNVYVLGSSAGAQICLIHPHALVVLRAFCTRDSLSVDVDDPTMQS